MKNLNDQELNDLLNEGGKTLIYFSAEWCGPCKVLKPIMEKMEDEFSTDFKFAKIDVNQAEEATKKFLIKNIPTCVLVNAGEEVERFTGAKKEDEIKKFFEKHQN